MARVIWTRPSAADLAVIRAYIAEHDPDAANAIARKLVEAADSLCDFPHRGRPAGEERELVTVSPYIIRYRVVGDAVFVIEVRHGRQQPRRPA